MKLGIPSKGRLKKEVLSWFNRKGVEIMTSEDDRSYAAKVTGFSDIQLVESYSQTTNKNILSKGGYDLVPFISNLYNTSNKKLSCYFEYYSETDEEILIQSSIVSQSTQKIVNELIKRKKCKSMFDASLITFSIEDLTSGTYVLKIEAIRSHGRVWKYKGEAFVGEKKMADAQWSATIVDRK